MLELTYARAQIPENPNDIHDVSNVIMTLPFYFLGGGGGGRNSLLFVVMFC